MDQFKILADHKWSAGRSFGNTDVEQGRSKVKFCYGRAQNFAPPISKLNLKKQVLKVIKKTIFFVEKLYTFGKRAFDLFLIITL